MHAGIRKCTPFIQKINVNHNIMQYITALCCSIFLIYTNADAMEHSIYPYRFITIINQLKNGTIIALFERPDPGFQGQHVLVADQIELNSNENQTIMILKQKNGTAHITLGIKINDTLVKQISSTILKNKNIIYIKSHDDIMQKITDQLEQRTKLTS